MSRLARYLVSAALLCAALGALWATLPARAPQGAPITLQTGSSARVISLIKDSSGQITGAAVNEA